MDIRQLKLDLINRITVSNDTQLLQTLARLMEMAEASPNTAKTQAFSGSLNDILNQPVSPDQAKDINELQQSIDDIFE